MACHSEPFDFAQDRLREESAFWLQHQQGAYPPFCHSECNEESAFQQCLNGATTFTSWQASRDVCISGLPMTLFGAHMNTKNKLIDGFTKQYNIDRLVYLEETTDVAAAIEREKQLKAC